MGGLIFGQKNDDRDPEWDIVILEIGEDCSCPSKWSENDPPSEPDNIKKYKEVQKEKAEYDKRKATERWKKRNPGK